MAHPDMIRLKTTAGKDEVSKCFIFVGFTTLSLK
jgi:hypothetical protein